MEDGEKEPKPFKQALSLVIDTGLGDSSVLMVRKRTEDSQTGHWSLPTATQDSGESLLDTAHRLEQELGIKVQLGAVIGDVWQEHDGYEIDMLSVRATITSSEGEIPADHCADDYEAFQFGEPHELIPAARSGSLSSRVLLDSLDIVYEEVAA